MIYELVYTYHDLLYYHAMLSVINTISKLKKYKL